MLDVLRREATPDAVATAVRTWKAQDLDDAIAEVNACGGIVRSRGECLEHPHGAYLAIRPVVAITKIGESAPETPHGRATDPLSGVRVLDLTRILAGR